MRVVCYNRGRMSRRFTRKLEKVSTKLTEWIGTPSSIIAHTLLFAAIFVLIPIGVSLDDVLLILTTALSLEAIYLAIFIQMTVNKTTKSLQDVEEDIDDIQEEVSEDDVQDQKVGETLTKIESSLRSLEKDIALLKKENSLKSGT